MSPRLALCAVGIAAGVWLLSLATGAWFDHAMTVSIGGLR